MQYTPDTAWKITGFSHEISPAYRQNCFLLACYLAPLFSGARRSTRRPHSYRNPSCEPGITQKDLALLEVEAVSVNTVITTMKKLTIGLIGNPNSGKTTLFNQLTGARQRVGNWAGVTVERKEGQFSTTDHQVTLVDLPGTYSLTTISSQTSLDEQIACHYILSGDADLLINVVDASNLERNLYLTLQLLELGISCIVALNMLDIAEKQNIRIEIDALSARLGCPVIPLVSTRGRGIEALAGD